MRILLIEDDKVTASFVKHALQEHGNVIDHVSDGKEGLNLARKNRESYDVIILDIILPNTDGLKVCQMLREEKDNTPILILSARDLTKNKVEGLNTGADDYLTKPFEISELVARIDALYRRNTGKSEKILKVRHVELDVNSHEVKVNNKIIHLTLLEYRLLHLLMKNKGKLVTRAEIIEKVWDMHGGDLFSNSIDVHITQLRKKIKDNKDKPLITTIRGSGYRFAPK